MELFNEVIEYERKSLTVLEMKKKNKKKPKLNWEMFLGYMIHNVIQGGEETNILANKFISSKALVLLFCREHCGQVQHGLQQQRP
jgi:hypothetical protein